MTLDQWRRLEKCENIVYGKAVASARRVCFETMALPAWKKDPTYGPLLLKKMWCDDMPYFERIGACLKNKIKTMPSSLISATSYKPQGPVTTGWKAMVIISRIIAFITFHSLSSCFLSSCSLSFSTFFSLFQGLPS